MKKILLITVLTATGFAVEAQESQSLNTYTDTATVTTVTPTVEERLKKQEVAVETLKKDSEVLKKEVKQLRSALPGSHRKFSINRVGSKQVIAH